MAKSALDKDLAKVGRLETETYALSRSLAAPGLAGLFLVAVFLLTIGLFEGTQNSHFVIAAGVIGGYMALNIGANDVANNMGPAVGGRALTMMTALLIAAICEAAGAILAGGDVVETVSRGIITPTLDMRPNEFMTIMLAALLAAALWLHLATILSAPVSTTHSIVGGVLGAGVAAAGPAIVSWPTMGAIAASWVISPVMGGLIAAMLLGFIKWAVLFRTNRIGAAKRWVPLLFGLMAGVFMAYLATKGLKRLWHPSGLTVVGFSAVALAAGWSLARPWVLRRIADMEDSRKQISGLFVLPLIFAAALLSFAHGANDVANAVGPLAAIVATAEADALVSGAVVLPLWVLAIGAAGIAAGLALFGPRLIRRVGEKITKMDPIRAYCVALSAAITVLVASVLGLPVSTTHIAIGGIFGVGFLRELLTNLGLRRHRDDRKPRQPDRKKLNATPEKALKKLEKRERRRLVRRRHVLTIVAAWLITVPAAGLLAGALYSGLALIIR